MSSDTAPRGEQPRTGTRRALALLTLYLLLQTAAIGLAFAGRSAPTSAGTIPLLSRLMLDVPIEFAFAIVGTLVAARHPRNPIGWLIFASVLLMGFSHLAEAYWTYALFVRPGALPGATFMLWVGPRPGALSMTMDLLAVLCVPTGRPPSRRWWIAGGCIVVGSLLNLSALALTPGRLDPSVNIDNPLGIPAAAGLLRAAADLGTAILLIGVLGTACSMIVRFRRSRGVERQQLKLLAFGSVIYAAAAGAVLYFLAAPPQTLGRMSNLAYVLYTVAGTLVAVTIGIAILRYRLFNIDIIIRRTLVYAVLTLALGATYFSSVVALQAIFVQLTGQQNTLAVVASTLVIAALFGPLRRRVQTLIDRRFFRRKYDAHLVLVQFAERAQQQADLDALAGDMLQVVRETVQPEAAQLWLVPGKEHA